MDLEGGYVLLFSCHSDTNFPRHALEIQPDGLIHGHLDNFIGVHCMMKAYFSGRLQHPDVRIELTYGEETDYAGARAVLPAIRKTDVVFVVDVTATPSHSDIVFEKCRSRKIRTFIREALDGMSFEIFTDCPDPNACEDEVDVYIEKTDNCCFLGVPVWGGDYNEGPVLSHPRHIDAVTEAICRIAEHYERKHHR